MLLGIVAALTLGVVIALFGWLARAAEPVALAAGQPQTVAETASRPRPPLPAESSQPSDRRVGSMILYSVLRSR